MEMEKEVKILNLDDILPNRFQPRIKFNESAILELAESIKEHGVIQPIVVRKISDKYEIIAGERRYKASILAGKTTIPAVITTLDDKNSAEIALIENVQRQDLTPIEEAISYKKILDMGYLNQSELADKLGKTQSTIANKLRLLNLAEDVQEALLEQKISERHARSLLKLPEEKQEIMLDRIISERLTVRKTDEEIKKMLESSSETLNNEEQESIPTLEVLDLERKEEEKMNQELNIPKEEIIEEQIEEITEEIKTESNGWGILEQPITNVPSEETLSEKVDIPNLNSVAPGFMDVEKIENEAQDIFKPQADPADLDMLLQATKTEEPKLESPMAPITPEVTPSAISEEIKAPAGKFFNMFNFSEPPTQTEDLEEKQVNMDFGAPKVNDTFMFNFNPLTESKQTVQEELENISSSEEKNTYAAFDTLGNESNVNQDLPVIEETKIEENTSTYDFPSFTQNTNTFIPTIEEKEEIIEQPTEESINVTPLSVQTEISVSESPIESVEPEFEPFNPYALNDNNEFTQSHELDKYRIGSDVSENIVKEPANNNTYVVADMRTVINTIRECAKTIENYGFNLDLDELDFEDRYEVKFTIVKK